MQTDKKPGLHIVELIYQLLRLGLCAGQVFFKVLDLLGNKLRFLPCYAACLQRGQKVPGGVQLLQGVILPSKDCRYYCVPLLDLMFLHLPRFHAGLCAFGLGSQTGLENQ